MNPRKLGTELSVFPVGLGCMGMSFAYGGQAEKDAITTLRRAVDIGVTLFDTAEVYGPYENEELLGKALGPIRDRVVIATKFGYRISDQGQGAARMVGLDSRPEHVKAVAEASLKRLGTDVIDLYYQHRVDPNVPIEDTVGAMAEPRQALQPSAAPTPCIRSPSYRVNIRCGAASPKRKSCRLAASSASVSCPIARSAAGC